MYSKTMIMILLFQTLVLSLCQTLPAEMTSHDAGNDNPEASMASSGFSSGFTTTLESQNTGSSEASNNKSSVGDISYDHYADNDTAADNELTADNGNNDDDDDDCKIPDNLRELLQEMNRTMDPLFSLPEPDPLNRTYSDADLFNGTENVKRHLWKKNPAACPTSSSELPSRRSADDEDRSACPWYYELDINTYRIPQVMGKVKCQCERCAGFGESYECVEVPYPVRVFKRKSNQCVNGFYEYEQVIEQHAIACTCAHQEFKERISTDRCD